MRSRRSFVHSLRHIAPECVNCSLRLGELQVETGQRFYMRPYINYVVNMNNLAKVNSFAKRKTALFLHSLFIKMVLYLKMVSSQLIPRLDTHTHTLEFSVARVFEVPS